MENLFEPMHLSGRIKATTGAKGAEIQGRNAGDEIRSWLPSCLMDGPLPDEFEFE